MNKQRTDKGAVFAVMRSNRYGKTAQLEDIILAKKPDISDQDLLKILNNGGLFPHATKGAAEKK